MWYFCHHIMFVYHFLFSEEINARYILTDKHDDLLGVNVYVLLFDLSVYDVTQTTPFNNYFHFFCIQKSSFDLM